MKAVGIRELKAHLSRFLREVGSGEVVLVTDRGRVVAEIHAPGRLTESESDTDRRLRRLAAAGGLRLGEPHASGVYSRSPLRAPGGTAQALLVEERGER
jgi:antitoxin (DNA-binding transcriptional repressor) of toxin-antitoxin stability system